MSQTPDYADFIESFDASLIVDRFHGDFDTGVNACIECCDRYVGNGRVALVWANEQGQRAEYTFGELCDRSAQVANALTQHGVQPGDRVSGLLPRIPDLVTLILGTMRAGAVYQPLFTAFGPGAIEQRLRTSMAKVVVTDQPNRSKLDGLSETPTILTIGADGEDFRAEVDRQSIEFAPVMRTGDDPMLLMSTSGTTGLPKGVPVSLNSLLSMRMYMELGLDLRDEDVYWNIADPGWAYGLFYAVIGPLLLGHQTTFYDGAFSVESMVALIDELAVTNLAGAPTAYRMLIAAGPEAVSSISGQLRVVSSAGEPLNPEIMRWFDEHLNCPVFDQYGQTETGMMLANHHGLRHQVRPGSAGFPMPGYTLAVVDDEAHPVPPGTEGILAVRVDESPLFFFPGYLNHDGEGWINGYYLTGDTVEGNPDGSMNFVGRSDDVISSAGYRIGPFDVESSLIEHAAVAESAVIGKPDLDRGEIVKAFVVLHPGHIGGDALRIELTEHVRNRLGKHAFPREIEFLDELPKTPSGKIQRFLLRQR